MSTLRQAVYPLILMSHMLGLTTFSSDAKGWHLSVIRNYLNGCWIVFYLIAAGISGYINMTKETASVFINATLLMEYVFGYFQVLTIWIIAIIYQRHHFSVLTRIMKIDKSLQKLGVWLFYNDLYKYILTRISIHFALIVALIILQVFTQKTVHLDKMEEIFFTIFYYTPIVISFAFIENIGIYTYIIKERYGVLNAQLEELQNQVEILDIQENKQMKHKPDQHILNNLRIICPIHLELTQVSKLISKVFGFGFLATFSLNFIAIMIGCYIICVACQYLEREIILIVVPQTILGIANNVANTYYLCYCCHTTVLECNKSGLLLHAIDFEGEGVKDEIQTFSMQITHEDLNFTAGGFFTVNYSLLFSIIGGLTTYIIILIQFSTNSGEAIRRYYSDV